jgi:hypothetical protein
MKKYFVLSLMVLAFAATAYGQDAKLDFRASGDIAIGTYMYRWNYSNQVDTDKRSGIYNVVPAAIQPNGRDWNRTIAYVEERGRLKFDALMGKELSGTMYFEMDSRTWGDDLSSGAGQASGRNQIGLWSADRSGVEVKNLYMDIAVPYIPVPLTLRGGIQPFGVRSNMFLYVDGAGFTLAAKADPVTIIGQWAKVWEGDYGKADDITMYGLHVNAKIDTFTIGGYGFWFQNQQYAAGTNPNQGTGATNSIKGDLYWLGAYADGKLGPVMLNFDFIYDTGKLKYKGDAGYPNVKFNGWASRIKIDFPLEAFNFGFVGLYGAGADTQKTSASGTPGTTVGDPLYAAEGIRSEKVSAYIVPIASETGSLAESEILFPSYIGGGFTGPTYTGSGTTIQKGSASGLWIAKLYGSYKVTPLYKVTLQGLYIGDTTRHGDTFGTSRNDAGGLKNNNNIGWELDLINEWQVYKNLNFKFGGGVLWAGDALKFYNGVTGGNEKPNTPWMFATKLTYSF